MAASTGGGACPAMWTIRVRTLSEDRPHPLRVPANSSVPDLKGRICEEIGVDEARQRLIFQGRVLKNHQTLAACSITDGVTVHMVERQREPTLASRPEQRSTSMSTRRQQRGSGRRRAPIVRSSIIQGSDLGIPGLLMVGAEFAGVPEGPFEDNVDAIFRSLFPALNRTSNSDSTESSSSSARRDSGVTSNAARGNIANLSVSTSSQETRQSTSATPGVREGLLEPRHTSRGSPSPARAWWDALRRSSSLPRLTPEMAREVINRGRLPRLNSDRFHAVSSAFEALRETYSRSAQNPEQILIAASHLHRSLTSFMRRVIVNSQNNRITASNGNGSSNSNAAAPTSSFMERPSTSSPAPLRSTSNENRSAIQLPGFGSPSIGSRAFVDAIAQAFDDMFGSVLGIPARQDAQEDIQQNSRVQSRSAFQTGATTSSSITESSTLAPVPTNRRRGGLKRDHSSNEDDASALQQEASEVKQESKSQETEDSEDSSRRKRRRRF